MAEIWFLCCPGVNFATHAPPGGRELELTASKQLENKRIFWKKMPQPHDAIHHEEVLKDFCPPRKICFFTKSPPSAFFWSIMKQRLERLSRGPGVRTFFAQRLECGLLKPFCRQRPNVGSPRAFERKTGALLLWMVSSLVVPECALRKNASSR